MAQPALHAWVAGGERLRLGMHAAERADPEPKALACYGLWLPARERMLLRFVDGRPISAVTCAFLAWATERPTAAGVQALTLISDNASWHISREVRTWIKDHNRRVKARREGCRLLVCRLQSKSPWLNPIAATLAHTASTWASILAPSGRWSTAASSGRGTLRGRRGVFGGHRSVRAVLYMAMLAAVRHSSRLLAFYWRFMAAGRSAKVTLETCMRKLLIILNPMPRENMPWQSA